ncbi:MAG: glycoside hydrolase family 76 protein [Paludibacter sp.]|nr:glycoside hydrolase family 76 protein [Paludibacter sp.]
MKRLFTLFPILSLICFAQTVIATDLISGNVYKITTEYTGNRVLTTKNSSLDDNTEVHVWTETGTNSQRWKLTDAGNGSFYIDNAYTEKKLYPQGTTSIVQYGQETSNYAKWTLTPVDGYANCYYIVNVAKNGYLELVNGSELDQDGAPLRLNSKADPADSRQIWKIETVESVPNVLTPELRTTMMQSWKDRFYAGEKVSTGFWGLAENMEVILDAYETTGKEEYKTMFEEIYANFISNKSTNWMGNDFNDDIAWAVLASIRAYFMFGNGDLNYLSIARTNFDNMYRRALYKVDGLYYLLRWKEGQGGTTSCVNGPAEIAACYLGIATGEELYFSKAKMLYASQRIHLFEPNTGHVYDTFNSGWASTYNQGTYLGAAVMLYNHYGDEMYKNDAEKIMKYTADNLCNSSGIVSVEGGETSDLPGFKGILMRYVRRFIVDLQETEYVSWMQKNAVNVFNNRNSNGITWTSWNEKAKEKDYTDAFGCFTAVSAVMNAPMDVNTIEKNAFSTIQAGSFNYISKVASENNIVGEEMEITSIKDGAYLGYNNVSCGNKYANSIELNISNDGTARTLEIRLDAPDGDLIATIQIPASDNSWKTITRNFDIPLDGKHNVYFVFGGTENALKLKSFKFIEGGSVFSDITDNGGTLSSTLTQTNLSNLTDNRLSTDYQSAFTTGSTLTITYDAQIPSHIIGYAVASGSASSDYDPAVWKLQASEDGQNWIDMDTQSGQTFGSRNLIKKYSVTTSGLYRYFQLVITQAATGSGKLVLSEWQLYGSSIAENDITADGGDLSVQYTGNEANLIDKSADTKYAVAGHTDLWMQYNATARYKLTSYTLTSAADNSSKDPVSWTLYGSADNGTWTVIDEQEDQIFADRKSTQTYHCGTDAGYKYFKLNILSSNGSSDIQVGEWQLFGDLYFDQYYQDFIQTGTLSADGVDSTMLSKLNDNNPETFTNIKFTELPVVIICKTKVPVQMFGYALSSSGKDAGTDPKSWILYGSKDGVTWNFMDRRTTETFDVRYFKNNYDRSNSNAYSYFKLTINEVNSAAAKEVNIGEWEVNGVSINNYDVTSNPGGTLSAQYDGNYDTDASVDERYFNLIDNDKTTKYFISYRKTFWAKYQSARPVKLFAYSVTAANDAQSRDPQSWTLYGSNNNSSWISIDKQEGLVFPYRYATLYFTCSPTTKYTYYKLVIDDNCGEKGVQLSEWQMFGEFNDYTSDITENGGVLTTSIADVTEDDLNTLIDDRETSGFYQNLSSTDFGTGIWFDYESTSPVILTSYTLTSSNDNPNNDPKNWTLQGSNDNTEWTDIDSQTEISFDSRCERKEFPVSLTQAYKYFRLYVTARKSESVRGFQLAEWELFGTVQSALIQVKQNTLALYPNPVDRFVVVNAPEAGQIEITNIDGKLILNCKVSAGNNTINLDYIPSGMYLVKIESDDAVYTGKMIKK